MPSRLGAWFFSNRKRKAQLQERVQDFMPPAMQDQMRNAAATVTEAGPGRAVICVSGELDLSGADEVGSALHALIADHDLVVLDASTLTFLDSYALRVLLRAAAHASERGAVFRIAAPRPTLRRVLEITGSDEILITWSDVETALSG